MDSLTKWDDMPSTSSLSKLGVSAVGYTACGILLMILNGFSNLNWLGIIVGALVFLVGVSSLKSRETTDRKAGMVIAAAGLLAVLSRFNIPLISGLSGTLLSLGAIGVLAVGILKGIKFFLGLKKRS